MSMEPIKIIIKDNVKQEELKTYVDKAEIFAILEREINDLLPHTADKYFKPLHIRSGVLTIACRTTGAASMLQKKENALKKIILEMDATEEVSRIRYMLTSWK